MKSAVATRFCCRCPLTDFEQLTSMFLTLILQYLNKLVERKIGDFSSPQPFHSLKVQGFNGDCIKSFAKFCSKLPVKVFALITYPSIEACDLSYAPPPIMRTFNLARKTFVERPKFVQGLFQRLWVVFLFTRAQCQVCVFHTEVCPDTLTRRWQWFRFYKVSYEIKPIITASVTLDCQTTNIPFKLTVFMERISDFVMSPLTLSPLPEIESEAIVFQRPTRLFQCKGLEPMPFFNLGSTAKSLEKTIIRQVNPFEFFLNRLTRQSFPMWVRRAFQIRHVGTHRSMVGIRQPVLISLTLPLMEIRVDLPHIIKQVAKPNTIGLIIKRIFVGFHGISHITPLTPIEWVGRHVTLRLRSICLPV